ncbi:MAG: class I SAM-dependent methyltransferase [Acidobacteriaceae bacterium]
MIPAPTERFTGRVESYRRYRPGYPTALVDLLSRACNLTSHSVIADIAAGTGLLTEVFLAAGFSVTAVEPNAQMRAACSELIENYPRLRVVEGTAETTALAGGSVDLITVAQAMHWFDLEKARAEFVRILKPGGWCAIIYNNRPPSGDAFHEGYERLLQEYGVDYADVKRQHMGRKRLAAFFAPSPMECAVLPNEQSFDLEGLEGRVLSSSYMPQPGHLRFEAMREAVRRLFEQTQTGGRVTMKHDCVVCWGRLP